MKHEKFEKGFSLIELLIVVAIIGIIAAIAIPNLLASRRAANEGSAISSLRTIHGAQTTYFTTNGNGTYAQNLIDLKTASLVDQNLGCSADPCVKSGYNFEIDADNTPPTPNWNSYGYPTTASGVGQTGTRGFYTNEVGVIYFQVGGGKFVPSGLSYTVRTPTNGTTLGN